MVDAFVFVYVQSVSSVVVVAMVKVDASALAEVEAVVAVVVLVRNWALRPVLRAPPCAHSGTCAKRRRILSLSDRRLSIDREVCRTTVDSDWFSLRRRRASEILGPPQFLRNG